MKKIGLILVFAGLLSARAAFAQQIRSAPAEKASPAHESANVTVAGQVVDLATGKPIPKIPLLFIQRPAQTAEPKIDSYARSGNMKLTLPANAPIVDVCIVNADENGKFKYPVPAKTELQIFLVSLTRSTIGSNPISDPAVIDPFWLSQENNRLIYAGTMDRDKTDLLLKVKMWHGKPLAGKVLGPDGKPVDGVNIFLHSQMQSVTSDAQGRFTINVPEDHDFDLLANEYTIPVTGVVGFLLGGTPKPKAATRAGFVHLAGGTAAATIHLEPTVSVKGRALTPEGMPANDLTFTVQPIVSGSTLNTTPITCTSAADGAFTIDHLLAKGTYSVVWMGGAANRDYDDGTETIDFGKLAPGVPVKFTARKYLNALMGKVLDADDRPTSGAQIRILSLELAPSDLRASVFTSDKNGNFTIPRLAAGRVKISATYEGKSQIIETKSDSIGCVIKFSR